MRDRLVQSTGLACLVGSILLALGGCATITRGSMEEVLIESEPSGATARIMPSGETVETPASVRLSRKTDYVIHVTMDGYKPQSQPLARQTSGMAAGNILIGGAIGSAIDHSSGADNQFVPNPVKFALEPEIKAATSEPRIALHFFNTTGGLFTETSGTISIEIDGKYVGRVAPKDDLRIELSPGNHELHIEHRDVWLFDDQYEIKVEDSVTYMAVESNVFSTSYEILRAPPAWYSPPEDEGDNTSPPAR